MACSGTVLFSTFAYKGKGEVHLLFSSLEYIGKRDVLLGIILFSTLAYKEKGEDHFVYCIIQCHIFFNYLFYCVTSLKNPNKGKRESPLLEKMALN